MQVKRRWSIVVLRITENAHVFATNTQMAHEMNKISRIWVHKQAAPELCCVSVLGNQL